MQDDIKIILIGVALFVWSCYLLYKFRITPTMEEEVKNFATEESEGKKD